MYILLVLFWIFKAEEYLKKSLECSEIDQDKNNESICHMNLANIYIEVGEYHKAMECLEKAIQVRVLLIKIVRFPIILTDLEIDLVFGFYETKSCMFFYQFSFKDFYENTLKLSELTLWMNKCCQYINKPCIFTPDQKIIFFLVALQFRKVLLSVFSSFCLQFRINFLCTCTCTCSKVDLFKIAACTLCFK